MIEIRGEYWGSLETARRINRSLYYLLSDFRTLFDVMGSIRQDLGFDDWNKAIVLQRGN